MAPVRLAEFIDDHREDLLRRCREKGSDSPRSPAAQLSRSGGIGLFLDQLVRQLRNEPTNSTEMQASAIKHGRELFVEGRSIGQLVHDYGAVCQSITDLAVEACVSFSSDDFRTLNRCLDAAIATAVAEFANQEQVFNNGEALRLRNLSYMAVTWFQEIRDGKVGVNGGTGDLLHTSLRAISSLTTSR